ncbi:hypothetical protein RclHR1_00500005 [Rhizophagus clarus]|uniref:Uncharacterized protein n=1 Tax=Rhizophagus clarus TaxID=94130 RepID=A0A2Z6SDD6_9GLOM|nr:hypothetical protein RclHR1_00500005 [Rhizophagus clarus]GES95423.1 hypothetical protein RCL_jg9717.t1 [Rhizophagus clarus]
MITDFKIIDDPKRFKKKTLQKQATRRKRKETRFHSMAKKAGLPAPTDEKELEEWKKQNCRIRHYTTTSAPYCYKPISHILKSKHNKNGIFAPFLPMKSSIKRRNQQSQQLRESSPMSSSSSQVIKLKTTIDFSPHQHHENDTHMPVDSETKFTDTEKNSYRYKNNMDFPEKGLYYNYKHERTQFTFNMPRLPLINNTITSETTQSHINFSDLTFKKFNFK